MKFLSLYWPFVAMAAGGGFTGFIASIKGYQAYKRGKKREAREREEEEQRQMADAALYYEPTARANIVRLNETAQMLQRICESLDEPAIAVAIEAGTSDLDQLRTEAQDLLDELAQHGVEPRQVSQPNPPRPRKQQLQRRASNQ